MQDRTCRLFPPIGAAIAAPAADASAAAEPLPPLTDEDRRHVAGDLAVKHGISIERATMLVDRYGAARHALEAAAQTLQGRKA